MFRRNRQEQSDAPDESKGRTVVEHGRTADPISCPTGVAPSHEMLARYSHVHMQVSPVLLGTRQLPEWCVLLPAHATRVVSISCYF
jgi:hypothetical protein